MCSSDLDKNDIEFGVDTLPHPPHLNHHAIPVLNSDTTTTSTTDASTPTIPTMLESLPHLATITTNTPEPSSKQQQHQNHPRVGVGVVVVSPLPTTLSTTSITETERQHGIWVGRRRGSHGNNTLALPGGHLEMYESWSECAIREVQEEMGITLRKVEFLHVTNDVMIDDQKHYITIFMIGHYNDTDTLGLPRNCEPDKCDGWELFTQSQLQSMVGTHELFIPLEHLLQDNPLTLVQKMTDGK